MQGVVKREVMNSAMTQPAGADLVALGPIKDDLVYIESAQADLESGATEPVKNDLMEIESTVADLESGATEPVKDDLVEIESAQADLESGATEPVKDDLVENESAQADLESGATEPVKDDLVEIESAPANLQSCATEPVKDDLMEIESTVTDLESGATEPVKDDLVEIESAQADLESVATEPVKDDLMEIESTVADLESSATEPVKDDLMEIESTVADLESGATEPVKDDLVEIESAQADLESVAAEDVKEDLLEIELAKVELELAKAALKVGAAGSAEVEIEPASVSAANCGDTKRSASIVVDEEVEEEEVPYVDPQEAAAAMSLQHFCDIFAHAGGLATTGPRRAMTDAVISSLVRQLDAVIRAKENCVAVCQDMLAPFSVGEEARVEVEEEEEAREQEDIAWTVENTVNFLTLRATQEVFYEEASQCLTLEDLRDPIFCDIYDEVDGILYELTSDIHEEQERIVDEQMKQLAAELALIYEAEEKSAPAPASTTSQLEPSPAAYAPTWEAEPQQYQSAYAPRPAMPHPPRAHPNYGPYGPPPPLYRAPPPPRYGAPPPGHYGPRPPLLASPYGPGPPAPYQPPPHPYYQSQPPPQPYYQPPPQPYYQQPPPPQPYYPTPQQPPRAVIPRPPASSLSRRPPPSSQAFKGVTSRYDVNAQSIVAQEKFLAQKTEAAEKAKKDRVALEARFQSMYHMGASSSAAPAPAVPTMIEPTAKAEKITLALPKKGLAVNAMLSSLKTMPKKPAETLHSKRGVSPPSRSKKASARGSSSRHDRREPEIPTDLYDIPSARYESSSRRQGSRDALAQVFSAPPEKMYKPERTQPVPPVDPVTLHVLVKDLDEKCKAAFVQDACGRYGKVLKTKIMRAPNGGIMAYVGFESIQQSRFLTLVNAGLYFNGKFHPVQQIDPKK